MKFSLARPALVLAVSLTLASCGGGGKATYPVNVQVSGLTESGLILSTNGMDYAVTPPTAPATTVNFVFPNEIEYGQPFAVVPKGGTLSGMTLVTNGTQPPHQTCAPSTVYPTNLLPSGTAGQLAKIQVYYDCVVNTYPVSGTITGLSADGLVLTNGSSGGTLAVAANSTTFAFTTPQAVPYNSTFGISVLTQPTGLTCSVTGGNGSANNGSGIMDDAATKAGGVSNLVVTCVPQA